MVYHVISGFVEARGKMRLRNGHTNCVCKALAEGAGRGFNAVGLAVFGVAGRPGTELAEILYVVHRDVVTEEVQKAV